jgi:putative membrane protein
MVLGRRTISFALGWIALAGALVSPLHWLGEHLFTFHMIEHEIVMAISAPLIVMARPAAVLLWGLPTRARRRTARVFKVPVARSAWSWFSGGTVATILHALAIWGWHAPPFFDAAVTNDAVHRLQHLSFFVTGVLFWWSIVWRSDSGIAAWHLFLTMLHMSILGALMALAPHVLYEAQTKAAEAWGLTPLEDQQLAGMIMWIPAGTIYAGAALCLLAKWISSSSRGGRNEPNVVLS